MMKREDKAYWVLKYLQKHTDGLGPSEMGVKMGYLPYEASATLSKTIEDMVEGNLIERFYRGGRGCYRLHAGDPLLKAREIDVRLVTKYERGRKLKYLDVTATFDENLAGTINDLEFPGRNLELVFQNRPSSPGKNNTVFEVIFEPKNTKTDN